MIDVLRDLGVLDALDLQFARAIARVGKVDETVALGAALASWAPTHGHVCLRLTETRDRLLAAMGERADEVALPVLPDANEIAAALRKATDVARGPGETRKTPLVFSDDCVYLDRYWDYEQRVLRWVSRDASTEETDLEALLDLVFEDDERNTSQRAAVAAAVSQRFTIVAGGPGTGKTSVVVRILAIQRELARRAGAPDPRAVLMTPTGKAGARMNEAMRHHVRFLPEAWRDGIPMDARTIHGVLGLRPGRSTGRYDARTQLPADIVVVDEVSMVDLPTMAKVLEATPVEARVVLLGDPHQLVSVDAGEVLGGLCRRFRGTPVLRTLDHSWRFEAGVRALAGSILAGDVEEALRLLRDPSRDDIQLVSIDGARALGGVLRPLVVDAFRRVREEPDPSAVLERLARFQVVCAHREGALGVGQVGPAIERWLQEAELISVDEAYYLYRPLLILRNDPDVGLHNGDSAVVLSSASGRRAYVSGSHGARDFSLSTLPDHTSLHAMTVHKAQGSEYAHVVLVLPERASPVLTRQLLYTAITRAKEKVTVIGSEAIVRAAIERVEERMSGMGRPLP